MSWAPHVAHASWGNVPFMMAAHSVPKVTETCWADIPLWAANCACAVHVRGAAGAQAGSAQARAPMAAGRDRLSMGFTMWKPWNTTTQQLGNFGASLPL